MRVTAAKDGVLIRRRLRIFAAAIALVLLCAVCVGGVSGATYYASDEVELRYYIELANRNSGPDTIIITDNIVLDDTKSDRRWGLIGTPLEITSDITIKNSPGNSYKITTNYAKLTGDDFSSRWQDYSWGYDKIDSYTIFDIKSGGTLTITGNDGGGTLTVTTNQNGRVFDVNNGGSLVIQDGSVISNSGFASNDVAESNNGGAVYVRSGGRFEMHGGLLTDNKAGAGGAVYVDGDGRIPSFIMTGGKITKNEALNVQGDHHGYGGGVWAESLSCLDFTQITSSAINMNNSQKPEDGKNYNDIYPAFKWNDDIAAGEDDKPIFLIHDGKEIRYTKISDAYDAAYDTDTIYIDANIHQSGTEEWDDSSSQTNTFEKITVEKIITIQSSGKSDFTLQVTETMFVVASEASLTFADYYDDESNVRHTITISAAEDNTGGSDGGLVSVEGGSFILSGHSAITGMKGKNGGAVYLNSGSCTLKDSAVISGCTASGNGGAVYVADGTFTVQDSASIDASNDVYLEAGEVVTAEPSYDGTIGMITLPSYAEGTKVVNVKTDSSGYPGQFALNPNSKDEDGEKILVLKTGNTNHLVISINPNYKITIPPNLIVNSDEMEYIVATILEIPKNARVDVRINGDFGLDYVSGPDDLVVAPLSYDVLTNGRKVTNNDIIATFSMAQKDGVPINAVCTGTPVYAGNYEDRLTFTFVYVSGETGNTR